MKKSPLRHRKPRPCPFCGCAKICVCQSGKSWRVHCQDCGGEYLGSLSPYNDRKDVVNGWNRRPIFGKDRNKHMVRSLSNKRPEKGVEDNTTRWHSGGVVLDGIPFNIGDRYRENDNRFRRYVTVTGFDRTDNRVQLNGKTWAKASRFNEAMNHGYIKVKGA